MKKQVILRGVLGKEFGREFTLAVKTPAEAVRALCANFKNFEKRVRELDKHGVGYKILFQGRELERDEELHEPLSRGFEIVPVLMGAGAIGRIFAGAALIAASFFVSVVTLGAGITLNGILFNVGAALVLGGVANLLAPHPKTDQPTDGSYLFNGQVNTTEQGHPVPICYGRVIVGSALISGGIVVEEITG